jgi:hypothetical protein
MSSENKDLLEDEHEHEHEDEDEHEHEALLECDEEDLSEDIFSELSKDLSRSSLILK